MATEQESGETVNNQSAAPEKATTTGAESEGSSYFSGTKAILATAIELITFLFAGFSSFFSAVAPPEPAESRFAIGMASFIALAVLLFIAAIARTQGRYLQRWWIAAFSVLLVIGSTSGFLYKRYLDEYAFSYPPETRSLNHIGGTTMLPDAAAKMRDNQWSKGRLLAEYGPDNFDKIWPLNAVVDAKQRLTYSYVLFVDGIAAALFCVIEGLMRAPINRKTQIPATSSTGKIAD